MRNLFISFSGGETSAYMAHWLLENNNADNIVVVFANTGEETEETLNFVNRCDKHFGLNVVWLEAKVNHGERKGSGYKLVDYKTASRNGEPFEEVIKKYGIPNMQMLHCTRELKTNPMHNYVKEYFNGDPYYTAIGIRVDEFDRMSVDAKEKRYIYPLVGKHPTTREDINIFWRDMPFRLKLKSYQGNCKWCWKKSLRKHLTIAKENPEFYDFPKKMEEKYATVGAMYDRTKEAQVFFRKGMSAKDILELSKQGGFIKAKDESIIYEGKQFELDLGLGCSESCEIY